MNVEIKIPSVGESIVEVVVGPIFQATGSQVQVDSALFELETDKLNQEVYAPASGKVTLTIETGQTVKVGDVVGFVEEGGFSESQRKEEASSDETLPPVEEKPVSSEEIKEKAKELAEPSSSQNPKERREKMSRLRRVISQRLVSVKNETAMLTTFNEVDMSAVMACRKKNQEAFLAENQVKLGYMSFFIKATVLALKEFPLINAYIEHEEIVYHDFYDISIAVSTDLGLMVPVLRDAEGLSSSEIEVRLKALADKARSQKISMEDLQGGTFTITNGGQFGSLLSTPILNPPQSGILGMHNIVKRPVVVEDQIEIRPMMYLALTYDHRIVDGKEAVSFLVHIKETLEQRGEALFDQ